jgi:SAM-dependent methyltransferase
MTQAGDSPRRTTGKRALSRFPELLAGGYSRVDGTVAFYQRINALIDSDSVVLDLGAGRGAWLEDPVPLRRDLRNFKGRVARVYGIDVDPAVLTNPAVDEAKVYDGKRLPLDDASVNVVIADHVVEHVDDPEAFVKEIDRVLRPAGWACLRTPNKYGYIGLGANLVPNGLHVGALSRLQPHRKAEDVFPTRYRMNTQRALRRWFPADRFQLVVWRHKAEPNYGADSRVLWAATRLVDALTPEAFAPKMFVFAQKR